MYRLQLNLGYGSETLTDGIDIRMFPAENPVTTPPPPAPDFLTRHKKIIIISIVTFLVFFTALVLFFIRRKKKSSGANDNELTDNPDEENKEENIDSLEHVSEEKENGIPVSLSVIGDNAFKHNFDLIINDRVIIGRNSTCDLCIPGDEVSGNHCELLRKTDYIEIRDLGSTNGTYINGVPINSPFILQEGDLIMIGRTELRITFKKEQL